MEFVVAGWCYWALMLTMNNNVNVRTIKKSLMLEQ